MTTTPDDSNIDQLLRTYFRRQMPDRFPSAPGAETTTASADSAWTMASGRVLAGLGLAGILAIYLGVAAFFPRNSATGLNPNIQQIGDRPMMKQLPKK